MRTPRIFTILVLISSAISIAGAQEKALQKTNPATHKRVVHIIQPSDQDIKATTVSIRYEVSSRKRTAARPDLFRVQLDSQPPIETSDTTYTFDGVRPGQHDVSVQLLDAKRRPIMASKAEMSFVTESPAPEPVDAARMMPPSLQKVAMFLPQAAAPLDPDGSAEMPLLTVIGLGVLVGGMVSAMKTRT